MVCVWYADRRLGERQAETRGYSSRRERRLRHLCPNLVLETAKRDGDDSEEGRASAITRRPSATEDSQQSVTLHGAIYRIPRPRLTPSLCHPLPTSTSLDMSSPNTRTTRSTPLCAHPSCTANATPKFACKGCKVTRYCSRAHLVLVSLLHPPSRIHSPISIFRMHSAINPSAESLPKSKALT